MPGVGKLFNDYAAQFTRFDSIPKTVFAAIAFSFAMRLNADDPKAALEECYREWETLTKNGIVRQSPRIAQR